MADKKLTPHKDLFIEEILAEAQALREKDPKAKAEASKAPAEHPKAAAVPVEPAGQAKHAPKTAVTPEPAGQEKYAPKAVQTELNGKSDIQAEPQKAEPVKTAKQAKQAKHAPKAVQTEPARKPESPAQPRKAAASDEIAEQARRALEAQTPPPQFLEAPQEKKKSGKKKGFSLFNRRKRKFA